MSLIFNNPFFSQSMHQLFNKEGQRFKSDENEPAVRKYLRASGALPVANFNFKRTERAA